MPSATWGTGFICPVCGQEATYTTTGILGGVSKAAFMNLLLERMNREGGTLTAASCGHKFPVHPGSRQQTQTTARPRRTQ